MADIHDESYYNENEEKGYNERIDDIGKQPEYNERTGEIKIFNCWYRISKILHAVDAVAYNELLKELVDFDEENEEDEEEDE